MPTLSLAYDCASRIGGNLKLFYAVAALAVLTGTDLIQAKADNAHAASGPSCDAGGILYPMALSSEQKAAADARFTKLCIESSGPLVDSGDSRLKHDLTLPGRAISPNMLDLYPPTARSGPSGLEGTIWVSYVVETDGRTSSASVIKSSGNAQLDKAAIKYVERSKHQSPGYMGFTPIRVYTYMRVYLKF